MRLFILRDFSRIRIAPGFDDALTPALAPLLFEQSVEWLEERFAAPHRGPTVVVTHFAPRACSPGTARRGGTIPPARGLERSRTRSSIPDWSSA
jgi:hypothetical protein